MPHDRITMPHVSLLKCYWICHLMISQLQRTHVRTEGFISSPLSSLVFALSSPDSSNNGGGSNHVGAMVAAKGQMLRRPPAKATC